MKKLFFIFIAVITSLTCFSQVKADIFGVKIGSDTKQQTIRALEQNNLIVYKGVNDIKLHSARFAGENWSKVQFDFVDEKVVSIEFSDIPSSSIGNDMFTKIGNMLLSKYPNYVTDNSPGSVIISDGTTKIELSYGNSHYIILRYSVETKHPVGYDDL